MFESRFSIRPSTPSYHRVAVGMLPENVAGPVAVEVEDVLGMPVRPRIAERRGRQMHAAVHRPDRGTAVTGHLGDAASQQQARSPQ